MMSENTNGFVYVSKDELLKVKEIIINLLLNNPILNVNARSVNGSDHTWNIVLIDRKYYFIDNTLIITRNKDRYPFNLKARSFSSEYLFFCTDIAEMIGHHILNVYSPNIEKNDLERGIVKAIERKLEGVGKFNNYNKPVYNKPVFNSIMKKIFL